MFGCFNLFCAFHTVPNANVVLHDKLVGDERPRLMVRQMIVKFMRNVV